MSVSVFVGVRATVDVAVPPDARLVTAVPVTSVLPFLLALTVYGYDAVVAGTVIPATPLELVDPCRCRRTGRR